MRLERLPCQESIPGHPPLLFNIHINVFRPLSPRSLQRENTKQIEYFPLHPIKFIRLFCACLCKFHFILQPIRGLPVWNPLHSTWRYSCWKSQQGPSIINSLIKTACRPLGSIGRFHHSSRECVPPRPALSSEMTSVWKRCGCDKPFFFYPVLQCRLTLKI